MGGFESALQIWVNMYNKADKERFVALLQRDRLKMENERLRERIKELEGEER